MIQTNKVVQTLTIRVAQTLITRALIQIIKVYKEQEKRVKVEATNQIQTLKRQKQIKKLLKTASQMIQKVWVILIKSAVTAIVSLIKDKVKSRTFALKELTLRKNWTMKNSRIR